jgi:hypothetical protein
MPPKDDVGIDGAQEYPDDEDSGADGEAPEDDSDLDEETSQGSRTEEASGGKGGGGQEGGEAAEAGEVHEVVAQPAPRKKGARARPSGKRPGMAPVQTRKPDRPRSRARLYAVVIGVIILVPVIGAAYFYLGPAGSIKKIDLIATPYTTDQGATGLALAAFIDTGKPSDLSGSADLLISYNGSTVYTGSVPVAASKADYKLPLNRFAVGNGNYGIRFTFQGFTSDANFPVTDLIQSLNVTANNITAQTNATLVPQGSALIAVSVVFLNSNDPNNSVSEIATSDDHLTVEIAHGGATEKYTEVLAMGALFSKFYPVTGNGNYTISTTFLSSKVKAGSPYSTIVATARDPYGQPFVHVQIPPYAVVDGGNKNIPWKIGGVDVTFGATGSRAYEGATIVSYWWNYHDETVEEGITVTKHYSEKQPYTADSYLVTLSVTDSNDATDYIDVSVTFT